MEKLTKILSVLVVLIVLANVIFFATRYTGKSIVETSDTSSKKPVVKIGVTLPLTGSLSFIGEGGQNAIELAKENLRKDTKYNYELIFEDDKVDPKEASTTSTKLITIDKVDALISFSSGIGNVVSPIAEKNKVLHINAGASDANVAKGEYNFIHWTTPAKETQVFIKELEKRKIKEIAIIVKNQQGLIAVIEDLKSKLKLTDIKVVSEQIFNPGEKDFNTLLLKAKGKNPDIYLIEAFSPELEILVKQAKELGINKLTGIESFELTDQPELFEGLWYVNAADSTGEFSDSYKEKYGKNPPLVSPNCYDAFNLIVEAYERAGKNLPENKKPTSKQAAEELSKINDYSGAVGELNVLSNHIIDSKAVVRMIKNGKPVTIG